MHEAEIERHIETEGTNSFYITANDYLAQIMMNDGEGRLMHVSMDKRGKVRVRSGKEIIFDTRDKIKF